MWKEGIVFILIAVGIWFVPELFDAPIWVDIVIRVVSIISLGLGLILLEDFYHHRKSDHDEPFVRNDPFAEDYRQRQATIAEKCFELGTPRDSIDHRIGEIEESLSNYDVRIYIEQAQQGPRESLRLEVTARERGYWFCKTYDVRGLDGFLDMNVRVLHDIAKYKLQVDELRTTLAHSGFGMDMSILMFRVTRGDWTWSFDSSSIKRDSQWILDSARSRWLHSLLSDERVEKNRYACIIRLARKLSGCFVKQDNDRVIINRDRGGGMSYVVKGWDFRNIDKIIESAIKDFELDSDFALRMSSLEEFIKQILPQGLKLLSWEKCELRIGDENSSVTNKLESLTYSEMLRVACVAHHQLKDRRLWSLTGDDYLRVLKRQINLPSLSTHTPEFLDQAAKEMKERFEASSAEELNEVSSNLEYMSNKRYPPCKYPESSPHLGKIKDSVELWSIEYPHVPLEAPKANFASGRKQSVAEMHRELMGDIGEACLVPEELLSGPKLKWPKRAALLPGTSLAEGEPYGLPRGLDERGVKNVVAMLMDRERQSAWNNLDISLELFGPEPLGICNSDSEPIVEQEKDSLGICH